MNSIRRFVYAAVLVLSALNFAPSLASAQDAAGTFTLTHEVRWQNAIVPAGKYRFTIGASGPSDMLTLRKVDGSGAGFMLLVTDTESSQPSDDSRLIRSFQTRWKLRQHDAASRVRNDTALCGAVRNS